MKRISFLGHFAWNQNKDLQLSPRRKEKAHTLSHTRQWRETPGGSCQLAGGQKSRRENQTGAVSGEKLGHCSPTGVRFQKPVSYHRHVSELCALQHQRGVLCSPRSMNRAAVNVNAEPAGAAGRGRGRSDPWELPPGHHGAFHLVRSMDMARGVLQPLWSCVRPGKDPSCLEERPSSTDRPAEE